MARKHIFLDNCMHMHDKVHLIFIAIIIVSDHMHGKETSLMTLHSYNI